MDKQDTKIFVISIGLLIFASFIAGRLYESFSMLEKIATIAEKHKQRFYDEGYEASKAEITGGILVGTEPTRDYSNYSDPCMLAQGASYNTDPNLIRSVEVSFPKFVEANSITFHGSDGVQRSIGAKELKEMTVEEIKNMATCIMIVSYSGGLSDELNDILIEKLLVNP